MAAGGDTLTLLLQGVAGVTPASLATGLTSNLTPYSLNDTDAVPSAPVIGIGSSPPATKRAVPPDRHDSRGSARTTASPLWIRKFSIDASEDAIDRLVANGKIRGRTSSPLPVAAPPGVSASLRCRSPMTWKVGPWAAPLQRTPMFSSSSRRISMKRTSIAIIRSMPTRGSRLTTCG